MFVAKALLVASLAFSVNALATPHAAHGKRHHDIAARVAVPEAHPQPVVHVAPRKRSAKRCKAPASSSAAPSSAPAVTSSPVVNVGADPATAPAPTTEAPAPTTEAPAPVPTTTKPTTTKAPATTKAQPTTTQAPPATTEASSGGSGSGGTYSGDGTFYDTGLGACGITNNDNDFIAAIGHGGFDSFPYVFATDFYLRQA